MSASLDLAAPKLGSGARFRKLSAHLASRGASNPDALAAYIGRKRYGNAGMARLSAGKGLANDDYLGIYLSETTKDSQGYTLTCPECSYSGPANKFGASGADVNGKDPELRTPAPSTGGARDGVPLTVRANSSHALANTRQALELAAGNLTARRPAVHGPYDVGVRRDGTLYHRRGGNDIAQIKRNDDGTWVAVVAGKPLAPHAHQRAALMEAVGTYNAAVHAGTARQDAPLQPPPQQTELMAEYGIPAVRALATPATSSASGPRMTTAGGKGKYDPDNDGDDDSSPSGDTDKDYAGGLSPKAQAIYKKLLAKGFPKARAMAFAKNSEKFAKAAS